MRYDAVILEGDARHVLRRIPTASVHAIITSPPYFNLRQYTCPASIWGGSPECNHQWRGSHCEPCGAWRGQLGNEQELDCLGWTRGVTCPSCYVCHLRTIGQGLWRALRDDGTLWLNLGDTFSGSGGAGGDYGVGGRRQGQARYRGVQALKPKDLCMVPSRAVLALQADGWYLRAVIPWIRRNIMPSSAMDRPTISHEWFFQLTKSRHYYYDRIAVMEPLSLATVADGRAQRGARGKPAVYAAASGNCGFSVEGRQRRTADSWFESLDLLIGELRRYTARLQGLREQGGPVPDPDGNLLALDIPTGAFGGSHYATYNEALIEPLIKASTSEAGCCASCGAPYERASTSRALRANARGSKPSDYRANLDGPQQSGYEGRVTSQGWHPGCRCEPGEPIPATVLDPFSGSGTTGLVACRLSRRYVGIELSAEYVQLSRDRLEQAFDPSRYEQRISADAYQLSMFD